MLKKLSLIFIRFIPVFLALKIFMIITASYLSISVLLIDVINLIVDVLSAVGILILSLTFKFCIYHRLMIDYIFISYLFYLSCIMFNISLTNIAFLSTFLIITFIIIGLVIYTYLKYGDRSIK